jgi:hypothetical protein
MTEPVLGESVISALLLTLVKDAATGMGREIGKDAWCRLKGASARAWAAIKSICQGDQQAERAVAVFEAAPQQQNSQEVLARRVTELAAMKPELRNELLACIEQLLSRAASARPFVIENQKAEKIINIADANGPITIQ